MDKRPQEWEHSEDSVNHPCCWDTGITAPDNDSHTGRRLVAECDKEDAPLITAAPELLDALELFVESYVEMINESADWDPEDEVKVKRARQVIAKAKGSL